MMFDSKKFSEIIKKSPFTSSSLSEKLTENGEKISKNTIDAYRKGTIKEPPHSKISAIAKILNVDATWFFESNELKVKYIPLIGIASCGIPSMSYNDDIEFIPVDASLARDGVYALKAVGESMTPKIQENDIVICDKEMECNNGNIVHYTTIDGESGIKRYFFDEEKLQVTLSPMNLEYAPLLLSEPDVKVVRAFKIIGDL